MDFSVLVLVLALEGISAFTIQGSSIGEVTLEYPAGSTYKASSNIDGSLHKRLKRDNENLGLYQAKIKRVKVPVYSLSSSFPDRISTFLEVAESQSSPVILIEEKEEGGPVELSHISILNNESQTEIGRKLPLQDTRSKRDETVKTGSNFESTSFGISLPIQNEGETFHADVHEGQVGNFESQRDFNPNLSGHSSQTDTSSFLSSDLNSEPTGFAHEEPFGVKLPKTDLSLPEVTFDGSSPGFASRSGIPLPETISGHDFIPGNPSNLHIHLSSDEDTLAPDFQLEERFSSPEDSFEDSPEVTRPLVQSRGNMRFAISNHDEHHSAYQGGNGHLLQRQRPNTEASYSFGYESYDENYKATHGHQEERQGDRVEGSYYVDLPNGFRQIVNYYADETGYHPTITYERIPNFYTQKIVSGDGSTSSEVKIATLNSSTSDVNFLTDGPDQKALNFPTHERFRNPETGLYPKPSSFASYSAHPSHLTPKARGTGWGIRGKSSTESKTGHSYSYLSPYPGFNPTSKTTSTITSGSPVTTRSPPTSTVVIPFIDPKYIRKSSRPNDTAVSKIIT